MLLVESFLLFAKTFPWLEKSFLLLSESPVARIISIALPRRIMQSPARSLVLNPVSLSNSELGETFTSSLR